MKRISEFFTDVLFDPCKAAIVMPLTTGLKVEDPSDVIGFAVVGPDRSQISLVTFPDRHWESSQDFTGLTPLLYTGNLVGSFRDSPLYKLLEEGPVVAFSGGMTAKALGVMMYPAPPPVVISLPDALATASAPMRYAIKEEPSCANDVARWLNKGTPLRIGGRKMLLDNLRLFVDNRFIIPKMGWNLSVDLALWGHVLECEAVEPAPGEPEGGEDLFQS